MPELPEVETIMSGLRPVMERQIISHITVRRRDLRIEVPELLTCFADDAVKSLERRAKYIWLHLEDQRTIAIHLGMSGKMVVTDHNSPYKTHDHVIFHMRNGKDIRFNDPRRFGLVTIFPTIDIEKHRLFSHLGVEPLTALFTGHYLYQAIHKRSAAIKQLLMHNEIVVGIGNIYACEALFRAKVHPEKRGCNITIEEAEKLVACCKQVLSEAIESGGSTLRDYVSSSGDKGYFQHKVAVYGKAGEPCQTCHNEIQRIIQGGRSTFLCAECQW